MASFYCAVVTLSDTISNPANGTHQAYGYAMTGPTNPVTVANATGFWVPTHPLNRAFTPAEAQTWSVNGVSGSFWSNPSTFTIQPTLTAPQWQSTTATVSGLGAVPIQFGPMTAAGAGSSQGAANSALLAALLATVQAIITAAEAQPAYVAQTSPLGTITQLGQVTG